MPWINGEHQAISYNPDFGPTTARPNDSRNSSGVYIRQGHAQQGCPLSGILFKLEDFNALVVLCSYKTLINPFGLNVLCYHDLLMTVGHPSHSGGGLPISWLLFPGYLERNNPVAIPKYAPPQS